MDRRWDAVVVGAGPAGCEFASRLSRAGYRVGILERRKIGREKPCGGGIHPGELAEFGYPPDEIIERRIRLFRIRTREGAIEVPSEEGITVLRSRYDAWLCEKAQAAGAEVKEEAWVVGVEPDRYGVRLIAEERGGLHEYRARILAHAGGFPCHPLDRLLKLPRPGDSDLVVTRQYWLGFDPSETGDNLLEFYFDEGFLPQGYLWIFPKRRVLAVGLGTTLGVVKEKRIDLDRLLSDFIRAHPGLKGRPVVHRDGGFIPVRWQPELFRRSVIILGDAGGFASPLHGGGVYQARKSAQIGAEYAIRYLRDGDERHLAEYDRAVKAHFYESEVRWARPLRSALTHNRVLNYLIRSSGDGRGEMRKALSILFGSADGPRRGYRLLEAELLSAASEELVAKIKEYRDRIEAGLKGLFEEDIELFRAVNYVLMARAKRLRASLVLLSAEAVGGSPELALPVAIAYELSHTASLVHDDLIDEGEKRRGRPVLHRRYGRDLALLAGDALLIKAFEMLSTYRGASEVDKDRLCRLIHSGTSFGLSTALGAAKELRLKGDRLSLGEYLEMIRLKTGSLVEAACEAGGILGQATEAQLSGLKRYGRNLGIAFQLLDDARDLLGANSLKGQYQDLRRGRPSPMLVHFLLKAGPEDRRAVLGLLGRRGLSEGEISSIIEYYRRYGSVEFTQRIVHRYLKMAISGLNALPQSRARSTLKEIAEVLDYWTWFREGRS